MYDISLWFWQFISDFCCLYRCTASNCIEDLLKLMYRSLVFRYDIETKSLKPLKPIEKKHLQSLNGDLDFLGPYPIFKNDNFDTDFASHL